MQNLGSATLTITNIDVIWAQTSNQDLKKVRFGGAEIWDEGDEDSPTRIPLEGGWKGSLADRQLAASASKDLRLEFDQNLQPTGYSVTITFNDGCTASVSK